MADFQALQQTYAPVLDAVKQFEPYGARMVGSDLMLSRPMCAKRLLSPLLAVLLAGGEWGQTTFADAVPRGNPVRDSAYSL